MSWFKSAGTTDHGFFEEKLSAYLDGELTPGEHEAVEHHLETCSACQWELETLRQTIQWTRELPTLTVPPVFTIPVPPEPVRSPRRRWNFLPILQGATALIAVLLVFAVAGDMVLGPMGGSQAPDTAYRQELAVPSTMMATQMVEKAVEEPAAEMAEAERTVVETLELESEVVVTQTEAPMAVRVVPTEPIVGEGMVPAATPMPPEAEADWTSAAEEEAVEEKAVVEEPVADEGVPEAEAPLAPAEDATAGGGIEPTLTLSAPLPLNSVTAPTAGAIATELALAPVAGRDEAATDRPSAPGVNWLRVVEVSLGAALVLLAAATIFLTIERRRAR